MFIEILEIAGAVAVIGGVVAAVSPKFRTTIGVLFGKANDKATTPVERQKFAYQHLLDAVNKQLTAVASIQATATQAGQDVTTAKADLDTLKGQYKTLSARLSDDAKKDLVLKITKAEAHVAASITASEAAHKASEQALAALNTAREQLADAADTVSSNEQKAEVAKVLNTAADVSQELAGINSQLGDFNKNNREIDHELLTAQQRLDNTKGSTADQELAKAQKDADAEAAMKRLDAEIAGTAAPTPEAK
jgi:chromosome segregation ATPase